MEASRDCRNHRKSPYTSLSHHAQLDHTGLLPLLNNWLPSTLALHGRFKSTPPSLQRYHSLFPSPFSNSVPLPPSLARISFVRDVSRWYEIHVVRTRQKLEAYARDISRTYDMQYARTTIDSQVVRTRCDCQVVRTRYTS